MLDRKTLEAAAGVVAAAEAAADAQATAWLVAAAASSTAKISGSECAGLCRPQRRVD
jgi:hypothetical protein